MKRFLYITIIASVAILCSSKCYADDKVEAEIKADFVSQYIWRGQDMGDFSVLPSIPTHQPRKQPS